MRPRRYWTTASPVHASGSTQLGTTRKEVHILSNATCVPEHVAVLFQSCGKKFLISEKLLSNKVPGIHFVKLQSHQADERILLNAFGRTEQDTTSPFFDSHAPFNHL